MICACIAYKSYEQCREIISREECVELRLDLLDLTADQVNDLFSLPVKAVATCRSGRFSEGHRIHLLETAIRSGASYVDIEIEMPSELQKKIIKLAKEKSCRVIVSYHNFDLTPNLTELRGIIKKCRRTGAEIVKIACQVNSTSDLVNLLALYVEGKDIISFGMGKEGIISRIAAPFLGAEFTYVSAEPDSNTAPGQITGEEMRSLYRQLGYK